MSLFRKLFFACLGTSVSACGGHAAGPPPAEPAPIAPVASSRPFDLPPSLEPKPPPVTQTFEHRAPKVGDHVRVKTRAQSSYPGKDGVPEGEAYVSDYELVASKVDGDAITEASVVFHENERHAWNGQNDDYNYAPKDTPLAHKKVRVIAEPLSVRDEAGAVVSGDVERLTLDIVSDIGMRGAMDAAIPDRPLAKGDAVDAFAPALVRVLQPRTWHFVSGRAFVKELTDHEGFFDVALRVRTDSGNKLELKGEARVRRKDRLVTAVQLEGGFEGSGDPPLVGKIIFVRVAE
jgi:hypothetical protein